MTSYRHIENFQVKTIPSVPVNHTAVEKWQVTKKIAHQQEKKASQKKPEYNLHVKTPCLLNKDNYLSDYVAAAIQNLQSNAAARPVLR